MLAKTIEVIIIDAGNTRIKIATFADGKLEELFFLKKEDKLGFEILISKYNSVPIFVSSVIEDADLKEFLGSKTEYTLFDTAMETGLSIRYETPQSLGLDRLANAVAIQNMAPEGIKVAIDLGTCIKFDIVNQNGEYLGGSISPGLQMRYDALHHFTGKLPALKIKTNIPIIGTNSHDSIHSGVVNGISGELNQFIDWYKQHYQGLTFFVTGGDRKYFDLDSKNNIFAHENLTLFGLYYIYKRNA